jgi:transposase-like protein
MNGELFQRLVVALEGLTDVQREAVVARLKELGERADSARLIGERLGTAVACVYCAGPKVVRFGRVRGQQRWRCQGCGRTFMALSGTPFSRLREKEKLLAHAGCMSQGMTVRRTAEAVGLTVDRAFRWRHRFLGLAAGQRPCGMTGVVEADETFFRRSYKGQRRGLPRAPKRRGGPTPGVPGGDWVGVALAIQRGVRIATDRVLPCLSAEALTEALRPALGPDAVLSTDGKTAYGIVAANLGIAAGSFVASYDGYGGAGTWHVQNLNAYISRLKGWMFRFRGVATSTSTTTLAGVGFSTASTTP